MDLDDFRASDVLSQTIQQFFGGIHPVFVVGICPISFDTGEFWIVCLINGLISELLSHLIHSIQSSNNTLLKEQLRGDSHSQLHVQVIVESLEGLGSGTSWNHVHHGSFYLQEIFLVEVILNVVNDLGSLQEGLSCTIVHDQVKISHSVSGFLILQTRLQGGQLVEAGGQKFD